MNLHPPHLAGVLAVDAGNSKTDVALVAADGTLLGTARGGGFAPQVHGPEAAVAALAPLVRAAAAQAGLATEGFAGDGLAGDGLAGDGLAGDGLAGDGLAVRGRPLVDHLHACLANADLPVEEEALAAALARHGWSSSVAVANDTFGLLRAGTDAPLGVAVVCGAGINCAGLLPDGRTARFAALGRLTGDWGGGGGLAREAMWFAARAEDGRGEPTALSRAIGAHFRLSGALAVAEAVHLGRLAAERLHELTPLVFACAEAGDPVALSLIDRQAGEVVAMARVALARLDRLDQPTPLVLGGGVLAARHPLLLDNLYARLREAAPLAEPRIVTAPPVLGAALLGLDRLGAGADAQRRLRAAYGTVEMAA
ncbi:ATPase [Streptomyces tateyamensis]|uniref:ATPase n=1 Tax=Streptomyces tateyamensis TaxID=565073 RepID=A0A2V4MX28_9ACTN|nr:BadF/BadG/BcrA/BcrD ATPase family protein [Streptomyces tateyamensis]PYC74028.1 ATPase [Streptomyces tateyamensis]